MNWHHGLSENVYKSCLRNNMLDFLPILRSRNSVSAFDQENPCLPYWNSLRFSALGVLFFSQSLAG